MAYGNFDIAITGDSAKFRAELNKATTAAQDAGKKMSGAFRVVQGTLAGVGVSLSVAGFGAFIKSNIDALDHLSDLAEIAGISATKLGGIGFAAKQSGVDIDALSKGIKFLNVNLAAALGGDAASQELFGKLGIDPAKIKSADEALLRIADRFSTYADGAGKAQIATKAFGKQGADLIPLLNQGGDEIRKTIEYFERYSGVNDEIVAKANAFNDSLDKLSLLSGAFGKQLTSALLPSLDALVRELLAVKEKSDGVPDAAERVAAAIRNIAKAAVFGLDTLASFTDQLGAVGAMGAALLRGDLAGVKLIIEARAEFAKETAATVARLMDAIDGKSNAPAGPPKPKGRGAPPPLTGGKGAADAEAEAKAIVAQQLKSLEENIKAEQDLLKTRETFLDLYYKQDLIGVEQYYTTRRELIAGALKATVAAYDQEIAVLEKQKATTAKGKDRVDIETKIAEVVAKRSKAESDAAFQGYQLSIEQTQAAQKFLDKVTELGAKIQEIRGNTAGATAITFDLSNKQLRDQIASEKTSQNAAARTAAGLAEQYLDEQKKQLVAQAALNDEASKFSLILDQLNTAQGRIALDRTSGNATELESLSRLSQANVARVAELNRVADAYMAIAVAANDPRGIANAEAMKLKIAELAASADLVADKFRGIFVDTFADAFASVIDGTKSVKDAFRDLERSLVQSISRIAANDLAEKLFGKTGPGSAAPSLLASLFTGGGGGFGGFLASLFSGGEAPIPSFATGTNFHRGGLAIVGERGPELVNLPRGSQVIPNDVLQAKRAERTVTNIYNTNVLPGASRQSVSQALAEQARQARIAAIRNG